MNIKEISKEIYKNAADHGFYDKSDILQNSDVGAEQCNYIHSLIIGQRLALIHSEVSEALEADRKQLWAKKDLFDKHIVKEGSNFKDVFEICIKNTFEDECADIAIRLFDMCEWLGIDLEWHIEQKMKYNQMREKMHGKQY